MLLNQCVMTYTLFEEIAGTLLANFSKQCLPQRGMAYFSVLESPVKDVPWKASYLSTPLGLDKSAVTKGGY